jgi:hypothetical protein
LKQTRGKQKIYTFSGFNLKIPPTRLHHEIAPCFEYDT